MEGGLFSVLTVSISLWFAVIIRVGMSLVVLKSINVLVLFVAIWMGTVDQDRRGTISVYNIGFHLGPG